MSLCTLPSTIDHAPPRGEFARAVRDGLAAASKSLPCKYFYDQQGSDLFDRICELPEYYPTRTELAITRCCRQQIAQTVGPVSRLVEYGSGSSIKTRLLLDCLGVESYVPIDISRQHLLQSSKRLSAQYPAIAIQPLCADYTQPLSLPSPPSPLDADRGAGSGTTLAYFPGSTIGNFEPESAMAFLRSVRQACGPDSGLLIGVDLKKNPHRLHAAYNDSAGITAQFNLNLLARINRELAGDFDLSGFAHYAAYNVELGRVEMRLVSLSRQTARAAGSRFTFSEGEGIHTENCYKHTLPAFANLAAEAGYQVQAAWLDDDRLFSVQYLRGA